MIGVGSLDLEFHLGPAPISKVPCLVLCNDRSIRLAYEEGGEWKFLDSSAPAVVVCWAMISADEVTRIRMMAERMAVVRP